MTRVSPRTSLHGSRLVCTLAGLGVAPTGDADGSVAEQLGEWLTVTDAIALFAALDGAGTPADSALQAQPADGAPLRQEVDRVRDALAAAIRDDDSSGAGRRGTKRLPRPGVDMPIELAAEFVPYRRYYLAHQRDMAAAAEQLRARARAALASASAGKQPLAALDAAFEQILADRERDLLATVPVLLERRFEALRDHHRRNHAASQAADSPAGDDPARWLEPGGWLAVFRHELREVLLAELDFRLLPVSGLADACARDLTPQS